MLRHGKPDVLGLTMNGPAPALATTQANNHNVPSAGHSKAASGSPLEALPKQFVVSMKKLFDILDDQHSGFVKFSDIEKGWQDDGCKGLPRGVIDSLRKVTPASGLLSFERFCAGLKICLLRNQSECSAGQAASPAVLPSAAKGKLPMKPPRPPSAPLLEIENPLPTAPWSANPTATVRPHNIGATQRALSMPQLSPDSDGLDMDMEMESSARRVSSYNSPPPPPKPPRSGAAAKGGSSLLGAPPSGVGPPGGSLDKAGIRHALQNWQMGVLLNEMDTKDKRKSAYGQPQYPPYRGCADGGSSSTTDSAPVSVYAKKANSSKRREPRRHTLQSGIDYNMLKRLKQFEEEREVLLLGLDAVEKAREWYVQQIAIVQEKIQYLGRMGTHVEQWSDVQQERLNFQRARVHELNRNLSALADTWERGGFPSHFNLAIRSPGASAAQRISGANAGGLLQPVDRLRQQNSHLVNEVNLKSDRITLLEREKQALMRELYVLQQQTPIAGRVDTGLMSVLSQSSPVCSSSSGGLGDADVVY